MTLPWVVDSYQDLKDHKIKPAWITKLGDYHLFQDRSALTLNIDSCASHESLEPTRDMDSDKLHERLVLSLSFADRHANT